MAMMERHLKMTLLRAQNITNYYPKLDAGAVLPEARPPVTATASCKNLVYTTSGVRAYMGQNHVWENDGTNVFHFDFKDEREYLTLKLYRGLNICIGAAKLFFLELGHLMPGQSEVKTLVMEDSGAELVLAAEIMKQQVMGELGFLAVQLRKGTIQKVTRNILNSTRPISQIRISAKLTYKHATYNSKILQTHVGRQFVWREDNTFTFRIDSFKRDDILRLKVYHGEVKVGECQMLMSLFIKEDLNRRVIPSEMIAHSTDLHCLPINGPVGNIELAASFTSNPESIRPLQQRIVTGLEFPEDFHESDHRHSRISWNHIEKSNSDQDEYMQLIQDESNVEVQCLNSKLPRPSLFPWSKPEVNPIDFPETVPGADETMLLSPPSSDDQEATTSGDELENVVMPCSSRSSEPQGSFSESIITKKKAGAVDPQLCQRRKASGSLRRRLREPRYAIQTRADVDLPDDGFKWRKYGQKPVKNSAHPRNYYRCATVNCPSRKRVERSAEDPGMVRTTYEGTHVHPALVSRDNSETSNHSPLVGGTTFQGTSGVNHFSEFESLFNLSRMHVPRKSIQDELKPRPDITVVPCQGASSRAFASTTSGPGPSKHYPFGPLAREQRASDISGVQAGGSARIFEALTTSDDTHPQVVRFYDTASDLNAPWKIHDPVSDSLSWGLDSDLNMFHTSLLNWESQNVGIDNTQATEPNLLRDNASDIVEDIPLLDVGSLQQSALSSFLDNSNIQVLDKLKGVMPRGLYSMDTEGSTSQTHMHLQDKRDFELLKAKDQGTLVENSISLKDNSNDVLKDDIMCDDEFISLVKKRMEAVTSIQVVDIKEAFTKDHSSNQTMIVLGLFNATSDSLEFYFESGKSMAKTIGIGLDHAKVVVKHGIIFEVQEIETKKWEKIWHEVKECSTKVFKIMKVRLPQTSGFIESGNLGDGRDVATSSASINHVLQDHTPIASNYTLQIPFLWEISKFFIMGRVIDAFYTKCNNDMWNENIEAQIMENYPKDGNETDMTWFQTLKILFSKRTSDLKDNNQSQEEMNQGEGNGNGDGNGGDGDFPRGYSNLDHVKDKETFTQVNVILLSGGDFFEKNMEPLSNRHRVSIERLDNVKVTPELTFGFHKTRDSKKIQITTSVVFALDLDCDSIESCPHSINHGHESCGHFGWFHDELYESLGPIDQHIQRTAYLKHDFKEGDYVSGKTTSKASTSKDISKGNEKGYYTSLGIGSSQVARFAIGASIKQQAGCMDHESNEQSIESKCNLTQGGFKIQAKHMMHLALLQYKCLAPYIEIIADQVQDRKYRYDLINHPVCNLQKTEFSGTWLPIGNHEVATYVFKANRQLREIRIEEETFLTSGSSGFKTLFRKRNRESLEVHIRSSLEPPITQLYEKQLYVNHAMSHLVDGHTYTLIEGSQPQNPFGEVVAPLVRFPILVNYQ